MTLFSCHRHFAVVVSSECKKTPETWRGQLLFLQGRIFTITRCLLHRINIRKTFELWSDLCWISLYIFYYKCNLSKLIYLMPVCHVQPSSMHWAPEAWFHTCYQINASDYYPWNRLCSEVAIVHSKEGALRHSNQRCTRSCKEMLMLTQIYS